MEIIGSSIRVSPVVPEPPPSPFLLPFLNAYKDGALVDSVCLANGNGPSSTPVAILMGRHPDCHVPVSHPTVSRQHLHIHLVPPSRRFLLTDLHSVHGTWMNEEPVIPQTPVMATEQDSFRLGASTRVYKIEWMPQSPPSSSSSNSSTTESIPSPLPLSNDNHEQDDLSLATISENSGNNNLRRDICTKVICGVGHNYGENSDSLRPKARMPPTRIPFASLPIVNTSASQPCSPLSKTSSSSSCTLPNPLKPETSDRRGGGGVSIAGNKKAIDRKGDSTNTITVEPRIKVDERENRLQKEKPVVPNLWLRRSARKIAPPLPSLLTTITAPSAPPLPASQEGIGSSCNDQIDGLDQRNFTKKEVVGEEDEDCYLSDKENVTPRSTPFMKPADVRRVTSMKSSPSLCINLPQRSLPHCTTRFGLMTDKGATETSKCRWHLVLDLSSLTDHESFKSLKQMEGMKGTRVVIPKIVIRQLDCLKRSMDGSKRDAKGALKWIEGCMVRVPSWIHVQNSIESFPLGATPPPSPPQLPSQIGSYGDLMSPTNDDHVLECAMLLNRTLADGLAALLTNDTTLKIKAMSEGLICEPATSFCKSLLSPYSERFLWAGSTAHGPTWTERPSSSFCSSDSTQRTSTLVSVARTMVYGKQNQLVEELKKNHFTQGRGLKAVLN